VASLLPPAPALRVQQAPPLRLDARAHRHPWPLLILLSEWQQQMSASHAHASHMSLRLAPQLP